VPQQLLKPWFGTGSVDKKQNLSDGARVLRLAYATVAVAPRVRASATDDSPRVD